VFEGVRFNTKHMWFVFKWTYSNNREHGFDANHLGQACQTQTTVRDAHWFLKPEKLAAGLSL